MIKIYFIKGNGCVSDILDYKLRSMYINPNHIVIIDGLYHVNPEYSYDHRDSRKYAVIKFVNGDKYYIDEKSFYKLIGDE